MSNEHGYAMAALLVMLAVMAILMSVAMPVWRQQARREKEAELIFRGEQYARAIALYNWKMRQQGRAGVIFPPSIDVLVEGRYLRKKYKDPMTKDGEFVPIAAAGAATPGQPTPGQLRPGQTPPGPTPPQFSTGQRGPSAPGMQPLAVGGVMGVRSKSEETSLRSYRGATRYDQWQFLWNNVRVGGAAPGVLTPDGSGGRSGPGTGPRGNNPNAPNNPNRGFTPTPFPGVGGQGTRPTQPPGGPGTAPGRGGRGPGL